jgi:hypothetical protein
MLLPGINTEDGLPAQVKHASGDSPATTASPSAAKSSSSYAAASVTFTITSPGHRTVRMNLHSTHRQIRQFAAFGVDPGSRNPRKLAERGGFEPPVGG